MVKAALVVGQRTVLLVVLEVAEVSIMEREVPQGGDHLGLLVEQVALAS